MGFCHRCQKLTSEKITKKKWNTILVLCVVHCVKCGLFQSQYVIKKEETK